IPAAIVCRVSPEAGAASPAICTASASRPAGAYRLRLPGRNDGSLRARRVLKTFPAALRVIRCSLAASLSLTKQREIVASLIIPVASPASSFIPHGVDTCFSGFYVASLASLLWRSLSACLFFLTKRTEL